MFNYCVISQSGEIYENNENLPVSVLEKTEQFKDLGILVRFCLNENKIYIQDAFIWKKDIEAGCEKAWFYVNRIIKYAKTKNIDTNTYPELYYGEPLQSVTKRELKQFPSAWNDLCLILNQDFGIEPLNLFVSDAMLENDLEDKVSWNEEQQQFIIHRRSFIDGQPDYGLINNLLVNEYLKNIEKFHPEAYDAFVNYLPHGFFAIYHDNKTKLYKIKKERYWELYSESKLREDNFFNKYFGPVLLMSYDSNDRILTIKNKNSQEINDSKILSSMLEDSKRIIQKSFGTAYIIIAHDSVPVWVMPIKRHPYFHLLDKKHPLNNLTLVQCPLTLNGKTIALLVKGIEDEVSIPEEFNLKREANLIVQTPYIAVESRIPLHMQARAIVNELSKLDASLKPTYDENILFTYINKSNLIEPKYLSQLKYQKRLGNNEILDLFADRKDSLKRLIILKQLNIIDAKISNNSLLKQAKLDIQVNDWRKYTVIDKALEGTHAPKPLSTPNPMDHKDTTIGRQLCSDHDKELSAMKSMEQLLEESRI